jgi:hypothetical protein
VNLGDPYSWVERRLILPHSTHTKDSSPSSSPRFWLHYFPIWISCGTIAVIYAACFWILRRRHRTPGATDSTTGAPHNPNAPRYDAVSYKLLWYGNPVVEERRTLTLCSGIQHHISCACSPRFVHAVSSTPRSIILPLSVARLLQATGKSPPSDLLKAGITILMLSGYSLSLRMKLNVISHVPLGLSIVSSTLPHERVCRRSSTSRTLSPECLS